MMVRGLLRAGVRQMVHVNATTVRARCVRKEPGTLLQHRLLVTQFVGLPHGSGVCAVMVSAQHNAGSRQSAAFQAQLHHLFYRSCCITSSTAAEVRSVRANADGKAFTHSVINFYHLSDVPQPKEAASRHKTVIKDKGWDICGRIYISYQGINAQFSGRWQDALAYTEWVASQPEFKGLNWREYPVPKHMFPKLKLKFRPNLISLQGGMADLPVTDNTSRATPVAPADWKRMLREAQTVATAQLSNAPEPSPTESPQNTAAATGNTSSDDIKSSSRSGSGAVARKPVVLDVRNAYEWDAGHFEGAQRPVEDAFNETPRETDDGRAALPDALKKAAPDTPVMMYCTGGIRCDVYSTFLRQQGFDNLYTLEGGIQNYLEEEESSEQWKGSLYVFDDRMAVAPSHLRLAREGSIGVVSGGASCGDCSHPNGTADSSATIVDGEALQGDPAAAGVDTAVAGHDAHEGSVTSAVGGAREASQESREALPGEGSNSNDVVFEKPRAAVPCALCGGEPELPHINCANVDCNVLLLVCDACKDELQGCCCEECRDHAPRLVRPIKDGAYRGMLNYTPKQYGARQRLMTPLRAKKLADARERRRARLRAAKEEKALAKQHRKQLARLAMEAQEVVQRGKPEQLGSGGTSRPTSPAHMPHSTTRGNVGSPVARKVTMESDGCTGRWREAVLRP